MNHNRSHSKEPLERDVQDNNVLKQESTKHDSKKSSTNDEKISTSSTRPQVSSARKGLDVLNEHTLNDILGKVLVKNVIYKVSPANYVLKNEETKSKNPSKDRSKDKSKTLTDHLNKTNNKKRSKSRSDSSDDVEVKKAKIINVACQTDNNDPNKKKSIFEKSKSLPEKKNKSSKQIKKCILLEIPDLEYVLMSKKRDNSTDTGDRNHRIGLKSKSRCEQKQRHNVGTDSEVTRKRHIKFLTKVGSDSESIIEKKYGDDTDTYLSAHRAPKINHSCVTDSDESLETQSSEFSESIQCTDTDEDSQVTKSSSTFTTSSSASSSDEEPKKEFNNKKIRDSSDSFENINTMVDKHKYNKKLNSSSKEPLISPDASFSSNSDDEPKSITKAKELSNDMSTESLSLNDKNSFYNNGSSATTHTDVNKKQINVDDTVKQNKSDNTSKDFCTCSDKQCSDKKPHNNSHNLSETDSESSTSDSHCNCESSCESSCDCSSEISLSSSDCSTTKSPSTTTKSPTTTKCPPTTKHHDFPNHPCKPNNWCGFLSKYCDLKNKFWFFRMIIIILIIGVIYINSGAIYCYLVECLVSVKCSVLSCNVDDVDPIDDVNYIDPIIDVKLNDHESDRYNVELEPNNVLSDHHKISDVNQDDTHMQDGEIKYVEENLNCKACSDYSEDLNKEPSYADIEKYLAEIQKNYQSDATNTNKHKFSDASPYDTGIDVHSKAPRTLWSLIRKLL